VGIGDRDYMRSGSRFAFLNIGVVPAIIAINVVVFIAWHMADLRWMEHNFYTSSAHLMGGEYLTGKYVSGGRWWTLLTAGFSQQIFMHLFFNMVVLYGFGRTLEERWGTRRFVAFYLITCVLSSFAHPLTTWLGWPGGSALGASGVMAGLMACFAIYYPHAKILLFFVLPIPAWILVSLFLGVDVWGLILQRDGGQLIEGVSIGHGVHLGGALCAVAYIFLIERGRVSLGGGGRRQRRARILRPEESPWRVADSREGGDPDERRLDDLLDKVSRGGLDSLSPEERETLERISARRRQRR